MECNKKDNLKHGWNRYCTGVDWLFKDDTIFGLYVGCPCKYHDIRYSSEVETPRRVVDELFRMDIAKQGVIQNKQIRAFFIKWVMWAFVRVAGSLFWQTWSSKGLPRYE